MKMQYKVRNVSLKLRCDTRFQHAFTAFNCVFKVMTLVWANQRNYFENATTCSIRTLKTTVATQLKRLPWIGIETCGLKSSFYLNIFLSFYRNIVRENVSCDMGPINLLIRLSKLFIKAFSCQKFVVGIRT